jgi:hypothetical protein
MAIEGVLEDSISCSTSATKSTARAENMVVRLTVGGEAW